MPQNTLDFAATVLRNIDLYHRTVEKVEPPSDRIIVLMRYAELDRAQLNEPRNHSKSARARALVRQRSRIRDVR